MGKIIDITGQKFGYLTVLCPGRKYNRFAWVCKCDCGNEITVESNNLRTGKVQSCGCKTKELISNKLKKNLIGKRFNKLLVLEESNERIRNEITWVCLCDCGNIKKVTTDHLMSNHVKSCGCLQESKGKKLELIGQTFGKLTVTEYIGVKNKESLWKCKCECGNECEAIGWHLTSGRKSSCGCLRSKGEQKIYDLLTENNIPFETQKTFDNCRFPDTSNLAIFDFYVDNKYLIEFDGEQHFLNSPRGYYTQEKIQKINEHDKYKTIWSKEHNIPLIRISYQQLHTLKIENLLLKEE